MHFKGLASSAVFQNSVLLIHFLGLSKLVAANLASEPVAMLRGRPAVERSGQVFYTGYWPERSKKWVCEHGQNKKNTLYCICTNGELC